MFFDIILFRTFQIIFIKFMLSKTHFIILSVISRISTYCCGVNFCNLCLVSRFNLINRNGKSSEFLAINLMGRNLRLRILRQRIMWPLAKTKFSTWNLLPPEICNSEFLGSFLFSNISLMNSSFSNSSSPNILHNFSEWIYSII